jgi:hypothetical protein
MNNLRYIIRSGEKVLQFSETAPEYGRTEDNQLVVIGMNTYWQDVPLCEDENQIFNTKISVDAKYKEALSILKDMVEDEWGTDYCDGFTMRAKEFLEKFEEG